MQSQRLRSHEPMSPPLTPINPSRQLESRVPASCKFPVSCDVSIGAAERAPTRAAEYSPATREGGVVKCGSLSATPSACTGGPERPTTPIGAQMIIGYVIAAALLECTLHHTSVTQPHGAPHDPVTNDELIAKFHAAGRPRHRCGSGATISAVSVTSSTCSRRRYEAHSAEGTHHDDDARTSSLVGSAGGSTNSSRRLGFRRNLG